MRRPARRRRRMRSPRSHVSRAAADCSRRSIARNSRHAAEISKGAGSCATAIRQPASAAIRPATSGTSEYERVVIVPVLVVSLAVAQAASAPPISVDACRLLTNADLERIVGGSIVDRKPATETAGGLLMAQCL